MRGTVQEQCQNQKVKGHKVTRLGCTKTSHILRKRHPVVEMHCIGNRGCRATAGLRFLTGSS